jgi:hypothetical protein
MGSSPERSHILYTIASVYRLLGDLATSLIIMKRFGPVSSNQRLDVATALVGLHAVGIKKITPRRGAWLNRACPSLKAEKLY